eukprot:1984269-Amphidinium_carterae.1
MIHSKLELEQSIDLRKRHVTGGLIAPADYKLPQWVPTQVIVRIVKTLQGQEPLQYEQAAYLYQLGETPPKPLHDIQPIVLPSKKQSTVVLSMELLVSEINEVVVRTIEDNDKPKLLLKALQQHAERGEFIEHMAQIHDLWSLRKTPLTYSCLVRIPTVLRGTLLPLSGCDGVFWRDLGSAKDEHAVVLFPRDEVTCLEEASHAVRLMTVSHVGFIRRADAQWGVRVPVALESQARCELVRQKILTYNVQGVPLQWSDEDLIDALEHIPWICTVIDGSRRTRRNAATWRVRADSPPPKARLMFAVENEIFHVSIEQPPLRSPPMQTRGAPQKKVSESALLPSWTRASRIPWADVQDDEVEPPTEEAQDPDASMEASDD